MIYLTDCILETIPTDADKIVWIGDHTLCPSNYEQLESEEQDIIQKGAKVQFWHTRNKYIDFKLISKDFGPYFKLVNEMRFTNLDGTPYELY